MRSASAACSARHPEQRSSPSVTTSHKHGLCIIRAQLPGLDLLFKVVVVDGYAPVAQVQRQRIPAVEAVVDGLGDGAAVDHAPAFELQPGMQLLPQRPAQALAARQALLGRCARQQALDVVDPRPALHGFQRHGAGAGAARGQLLEFAAGMGSTPSGLTAWMDHGVEHRAVARILVGQQRAAPSRLGARRALAAEEGQRVLRPAAGAELVDDPRWTVQRAARVGPYIGLLGLAPAGVQQRHRGLVGQQHRRAQHEALVHRAQRLKCRTPRAAPGRQRRARGVHARARVDVLLPVVRQVIGKAADQRVRHQPAGGDAAIDHVGLGRLLHQLLAAPAGPLAVDVAVHEELCRDDVELLAHILAHTLHRRTAAGVRASGVGRLVVVLDALQMLGQRLAARPARRILRRRGGLRQLGLQLGQLRLQAGLVLDQRLGEQRALLRRHGLGLGAELPALEPCQLEVDLLQPRIAPGDLAALVLDLARLLLDLLAHLAQHLHDLRRQLLLVDTGQVWQTRHAPHDAA